MNKLLCLLALVSAPLAWAGGEDTYQAVCAKCHAEGLAGAPKTGDKKVWGKLIKEGLVSLSVDAYGGVRAMPAQGGQADLGLPEFTSALVYMANQSGANWKEADEATLKKISERLARKKK